MHKSFQNSLQFIYCFVFFSFITTSFLRAQENYDIIDSYEDYTEVAREIAYLHLNKSTYVKGENIGFTAYVFDKKDKKPSLLTTNLYVSIEDENKNILKHKLIKVTDGVASNTFEVDSLFTSGYYKIKAYTNWMRNFNEKNYFTESIKIIDLDYKERIKKENVGIKIDAQFLPESGHLLDGVINTIGVIIKNKFGFGIPFAKGEVVDKNNEILTSFETNQFGIGKFQLLPEIGNLYNVNLKTEIENRSVNINSKVEEEGIIISLKTLKSKIFISLITNKKTLSRIKNKRHTLLLHNGDQYDLMDIYFTDNTEITKIIESSSTATGINILTLFNEDDKPIAERLFFNYDGIDIITPNNITSQKTKDSTNIILSFKTIDISLNNSISISVLPQETKSYNRHHNIISSTYLEPYVNGAIERANYYFTDINLKKKFELDNLLITQGWSSYNWDEIFNEMSSPIYAFEQGITIKANLPSNKAKENTDATYLMHAFGGEAPRFFEVKKDETSFVIENLFLEGSNNIYLSKIDKDNELLPASLYLQYFPSNIPILKDDKLELIEDKSPKTNIVFNSKSILSKNNNIQKLDEVIVKSKISIEKERKNELSVGRFGKITIINEQDTRSYVSLLEFIRDRVLTESTRNKTKRTSDSISTITTPNYFLDDVLLLDKSNLIGYYLSDIEFIEFNRFGIGDGLRSPNGSVKIYTKKTLPSTSTKKTTKTYNLPLAFSPEKVFYTPKYRYYHDDFYTSYGVIDWKPRLTFDKNGNVTMKIAKPKVPITLFIEGIANDGSYIIEEKVLSFN